jgi:hypothetical protein
MNHGWRLAVVSSGLALATPSLCYAHAIHTVYFGLGPLAFLVPFSEPSHLPKTCVHYLSIFLLITIQTLLLRYAFPGKSMFGNLWRAGVAFALSKVGESVSCIAIIVAGQWILTGLAWSFDSWETVYVVPVLVFGAGMLVNAALVMAFYRQERPSKRRLWPTAFALSVTSFAVLLLSNLAMMRAHWI